MMTLIFTRIVLTINEIVLISWRIFSTTSSSSCESGIRVIVLAVLRRSHNRAFNGLVHRSVVAKRCIMIDLNPLLNGPSTFSIKTEWLLLLIFLLVLQDISVLSYTLARPFKLEGCLIECSKCLTNFVAGEVLRITNILLNQLDLF